MKTGERLLRVLLGVVFLYYGIRKLREGPETLIYTGSSMCTIGVCFGYLFWGIVGAIIQLWVGRSLFTQKRIGVSIVLGSFTAMLAIMLHVSNGDDFSRPMSVFLLCYLLLVILFIGKFNSVITREHITKK